MLIQFFFCSMNKYLSHACNNILERNRNRPITRYKRDGDTTSQTRATNRRFEVSAFDALISGEWDSSGLCGSLHSSSQPCKERKDMAGGQGFLLP
ncbi:hypothetical protein CDAR_26321 [Caerostris darwini]|uniref:Uncharacterized protein n=1 Tax=Caerostris darwini TaxID=1538125 RepID=A0AAV4PRM6_9ARAC|nr:hypothetical protein CDAR_26321 [Caerostris darwini]